MQKLKGLFLLAVVAVLTACASSSPDVVKRGDAQRLAVVEDAVVLSVRTVTVDGSQSGIGATVGGVVGAIGGFGGSSVQREAQVLGVLAGVAGAAEPPPTQCRSSELFPSAPSRLPRIPTCLSVVVVSTTAPAPSPKSTHVVRSDQSTTLESFSAPMTRACR